MTGLTSMGGIYFRSPFRQVYMTSDYAVMSLDSKQFKTVDLSPILLFHVYVAAGRHTGTYSVADSTPNVGPNT